MRMLVTFVAWSSLLFTHTAAVLVLPRWTYEAKEPISNHSHYDFGLAMGQQTASNIKRRYRLSTSLDFVLQFYNTTEGKKIFKSFVDLHDAAFPEYMDELRGIADGANQPFSTVFIMNLLEEMRYAAEISGFGTFPRQDHCSDYSVCDKITCFDVHNEDSGVDAANTSTLITVNGINGPNGVNFTGFAYAGDLVTGGFGWNTHRVAFSLNYLGPVNNEVAVPGLGRVFIARDMLQADSVQDCLKRGTRMGQCAAHNYQIMTMNPNSEYYRTILNVEVASHGRFSVHPISASDEDPPYWHTNMFQSMQIHQNIDWSSFGRNKRVSELPIPTDAAEALSVLGDQYNRSWPIFHDEVTLHTDLSKGWTLATVHFDIDAGKATLFSGNPKNQKVQYSVYI